MKKVAYLILAHKYPEQLVRLLKRLDSPHTIIFIHLDSTVDIHLFQVAVNQASFEGEIHFIAKRYHAIRSGFNMIRATLEGLKAIVASGHDFRHACLLSGQDYPLKNISEFHQFLEENPQKNFITHYPLPFPYWVGNGGLDRVHFYHVVAPKFHLIHPILPYIQTRLHRKAPVGLWKIVHKIFEFIPPLNKTPRKFLPNATPYGGSQWWMLSAEAVHFILDYLKRNPAFYNYFKYTYVPDESFFQSLLVNYAPESIKSNLVDRNFRYIVFEPGAGSPQIFTTSHLQELLDSGRFFARKFDIGVDSEILNKLDEMSVLEEKQV